jgi:hypothetical protein
LHLNDRFLSPIRDRHSQSPIPHPKGGGFYSDLKIEYEKYGNQDEIENCDLNIATAYMFLKEYGSSYKLFVRNHGVI